MLILAWLLPPCIALLAAALFCRLAIRFAPALRFVDRPGSEAHKLHARTIPYGGGPAMAVAMAGALLAASLLPLTDAGLPIPAAVLAGALALVVVGMIDDARPMPARLKLLLQMLICAATVSTADLPVDFLRSYHPALAWLAAWGWLLLVTNAYNLLDHADGLSGSVALVGCAALAGGAVLGDDAAAARIWLALAAALAGFLLLNRPPARIYMGDAGSLAVGFLIGCGTLSTTFWPSDQGGSALALLSPLLICAIPLFDTGAVMVKRIRRGKPLMRGDRNHISHRLTRLGIGPKASLGAVVALQVGLAASSFQLRNADPISAGVALAQAAAICIALVLLETSRDHG